MNDARQLLQRWLEEHPHCIHADETRAFLATPTEQPSVVGEAEVIWLHRFINCVPFGEHAPASDLAKAHRIVEALDRTRFGGEGK